MLHNFINTHHEQITNRAALLSRARDPQLHPESSPKEVSMFLTQVSTTLSKGTRADNDADSLDSTAARNGAKMLRAGHPIVDVVQSYGDVCQAVTALAAESSVAISAADFCIFNRCLDDAIGHAVSEYNRITDESRSLLEAERLGAAAHELRDQLQTAQMSLQVLKMSGAPVDGAPGQMLERALGNLGALIERTLSEVRLSARVDRREAIALTPFLQEIAATAAMHAQHRGLTFTIDSDVTGTVEGDRHILMMAVMNVVYNALKFTRPGGNVKVTARTTSAHLSIAVEDQCGGIPDSAAGIFGSFTDRRGTDRSGLGLGLSMAKKAVRSHLGKIAVRNLPGAGCVFTIELPLVAIRLRPARPRRKNLARIST